MQVYRRHQKRRGERGIAKVHDRKGSGTDSPVMVGAIMKKSAEVFRVDRPTNEQDVKLVAIDH